MCVSGRGNEGGGLVGGLCLEKTGVPVKRGVYSPGYGGAYDQTRSDGVSNSANGWGSWRRLGGLMGIGFGYSRFNFLNVALEVSLRTGKCVDRNWLRIL